jgi:hypothetical protein
VRKLLVRITILLLLAAAGWAGWNHRGRLATLVEDFTRTTARAKPVPDPETYTVLSEDLESHRARLSASYARASTNEERAAILSDARLLLESSLPLLMRCWLGTPWDFNGTAHEPGGGKVACGYFVSSVLQDAGFQVERILLAQQASQNILGTFLPQQQMMIRVGMEYDTFLSEVAESGAGVYIVGLDNHVAFLVVTAEGEIRFVHSSGASPYCVVDESREDAKVLRASRYRVSGNLTANGEVLRNWLLGTAFKTRIR